MITKELLANATPEAIRYIKEHVKSNNKSDYQKLKKLFNDKQFEAKSFEDVEIDILNFDWQSENRDRNWWWQLQALPFLNWYANSLALQTEEERSRYFSNCLSAIHCWVKHAKENKASPLAWHDHATAFRVRNLSNWLLFCHTEGQPVSDDGRAELLGEMVAEHLDWLQEDVHYSKHTNHGFDQAMIALTIGLMFGGDDFELYRERNRERLKDEVTFAFTDEGVHKENSPGYQKMMLGRLKQLRTLAPLGEKEISDLGERYIEKAEIFLRAVTLPNGYLPMIGDTRGLDEGLPYVQQDKVDILDYSRSGYVIIRGFDGRDKEFFILLKNAHESNYHRHDDDMMIYLYYDGEVVLGDGGLYKHQEKDERRKHLRSYLSHSVPYYNANAIRKMQDLPVYPSLSRLDSSSFQMTSAMFSERLERKVTFSTLPSLMVDVSDCVIGNDAEAVWANFFFDKKFPVDVRSTFMVASLKSSSFILSFQKDAPLVLRQGWDVGNGAGAIVSRNYGETEDALSISIFSLNKRIAIF